MVVPINAMRLRAVRRQTPLWAVDGPQFHTPVGANPLIGVPFIAGESRTTSYIRRPTARSAWLEVQSCPSASITRAGLRWPPGFLCQLSNGQVEVFSGASEPADSLDRVVVSTMPKR